MSFEDPDIIIKAINTIQNIINISEMNSLRLTNFEEYESKLKCIFPKFNEDYPIIFNMIIKKEDITYLYTMLQHIEKIRSGEISKEDSEKIIGEELAEQYVYPLVDKKEKK